MFSTLRKLLELLSAREKRQALFLLVMMLLLAIVEMAGVASILPFIAVLSDPSLIQTNQYLRKAYDGLGFSDTNSFFIFLSALLFFITVVRTVLSAVTSYGTLRYAQMRSHSLSVRLLSSYLRRPYGWFLNRHSADMSKSVLSEVEQVINGSLTPAMRLASRGFVTAFLVALVVLVDPFAAIVAFVGTALAYGVVYVVIRGYLLRKGKERLAVNRQRYKVAQEVLSGIKEVKVGGLELGYIKRFDKASLRFGRLKSELQLARQVPGYLLELIAVGGILTIIMVLLIRASGNLDAALPVIGLYAFASLRLLPAIQTIYQSVVTFRFGGPAVDALHADLFEAEHTTDLKPIAPLGLCQDIVLDQVSFAYQEATRTALADVSLTIPARTTAAFVGPSGAGKSTLIDIILGMLEPQNGALKVDGVRITRDNVRAWQKSVGYVPQQIFLADETIASNIALGVPTGKIDMQAVERAARLANLHDFIIAELPKGYETEIGDRGVRLSGGQRQRIGIARALYNNPSVLVLDEATSALDTATEQQVMAEINELSKEITILMIAHRLSTVENCDVVYKIELGRITESGTFNDVIKHGSNNRALMDCSELKTNEL